MGTKKDTLKANSADGSLFNGISKYKQYTVFLGLFLLIVISSILSPYFLTVRNIFNVLRQISIIGLLSVGMTFVIISGGIDLSVGSIIALICVAGASLLSSGISLGLTIIICIILGFAIGIFAGFFISYGKLEAFIVTLAVMSMARSIALLWADGRTIMVSIPDTLRFLGNGYLGVVPIPVIIMLIVFAIAWIILKRTPFGRYVYAIGGNEEAARLSGIKVNLNKIYIFMISSTLASIGGLLYLARLSVGEPTAGTMYELDAIAAVVVGGTSFAGGVGGVGLTLIGAIIIGLINNVMNLLHVSPYAQGLLKGIIILLAVLASKKNN